MKDMGGFRIPAMRTVSLTATGRRTGSRRSEWAGSKVRRGARWGRGAPAATRHGTRVESRSAVYALGPKLNVKLLALNVGLMLFP